MMQKWPSSIVLVRHGKTIVNIEKERLKEKPTKELYIKTPCRDMDLPITKKGVSESERTGKILRKYPKFDVIYVSPYKRATQTAEIIIKELGYNPQFILEERIREKDFGVFDRLTERGRKKFYPIEAKRKEWEGEYYYRVLGGESYPDVALRIHDFLNTLIREYKGKNVLIIAHSLVILMFRKLLERLSEKEVLDLHTNQKLKNCSISSFIYDKRKNKLRLKEWNRIK